MTYPKYFESRLAKLEEVFLYIEDAFLRNEAVDHRLQHYFRKNKQFGSKDRKLVASACFAYFRWYGWLKELEISKLEKLLIAYGLDDNKVDPFILFWQERAELKSLPEFNTLEEKLNWIRQWENSITLEMLFPKGVPSRYLEYLEVIQSRAPLWLRLLPGKELDVIMELKSGEFSYNIHPSSKSTVQILDRKPLQQLESFKAGYFEIQDISSQGIGKVCSDSIQRRWWDVCAGAGGKTLQLAAAMPGSVILATDVRRQALDELEKRRARQNLQNIKARYWDGESLPAGEEAFDGILIDAPCSCSGTWRRNPWMRWQSVNENLSNLVRIQSELLNTAANQCEVNGVIVYATCSLYPEENENQVNEFLQEHPDFQLEDFEHPFSGEKVDGMLYFYPDEVDGDIMFIAKIRRIQGAVS